MEQKRVLDLTGGVSDLGGQTAENIEELRSLEL